MSKTWARELFSGWTLRRRTRVCSVSASSGPWLGRAIGTVQAHALSQRTSIMCSMTKNLDVVAAAQGKAKGLPFRGTKAIHQLLERYGYSWQIDHQSLSNEFFKRPPPKELGAKIVSVLFGEVESDFEEILAARDLQISKSRPRDISEENWRLEAQIDPLGSRAEVNLERTIVSTFGKDHKKTWFNQVPVGSGLADYRFKTCAIDLVRGTGNNSFEFIELKLKSNTPMYAMVELLQYSFVWLLSREGKRRARLGYGPKAKLLSADQISLCVLAPQEFYGVGRDRAVQQVNYDHLVEGVRLGLSAISPRITSFRFEKFGPRFSSWDAKHPDVLPLVEN